MGDQSLININTDDIEAHSDIIIDIDNSEKNKLLKEKVLDMVIEDFKREIEGATTEIVPLNKFNKAESYHEDYYARNKDAPYCQVIINPKLTKLRQKLSGLLKT